MGTCISKCRRPRPPTHKHKEESLLVQDKLVISKAPTTLPDVPLPNKQSNSSLVSSPSPSSDSCSSIITSSSTCSTSTLSSSSSTCSSSPALVSKDRLFSNEFLWARLKENPHIIPNGLDPVKEGPVKAVAPKFPTRELDSSSKSGRIVLPPQKRGRDSSPNLAQQRSLRKEFEKPRSPSSISRRNFGSPSPSRRFNGDPCRGIPINTHKRYNSPKRSSDNNGVKPISSSARKENLQLRSPINKVSRDGSSQLMRKRETCTHHVQDGIDQDSVGAVVYNKDSNSPPIDDINNPLISLDCFIFL